MEFSTKYEIGDKVVAVIRDEEFFGVRILFGTINRVVIKDDGEVYYELYIWDRAMEEVELIIKEDRLFKSDDSKSIEDTIRNDMDIIKHIGKDEDVSDYEEKC